MIPIDATNNLPTLISVVPVAESAIREFRQNGHVLITGLLNANEVKGYRPIILQAVDRMKTETRKMAERDTYGKAFLQVMNLWESDEEVKKFVLAKRFASVAAQLTSVKNVRLYHDQALFKEPGGGPTPWHQDQYYWPLDTTNTITMWMPLIDISVEMGMLTFASGSHKKGLAGNMAISDESEHLLDKYVEENNFEIECPLEMKAGDASWHYGNTLHKAPGNNSAIIREVMTVIYFADGAKVTMPNSTHQEADRQRWLKGIAPGMPADSELNPLLL